MADLTGERPAGEPANGRQVRVPSRCEGAPTTLKSGLLLRRAQNDH
ncbi:hypothetical protein [Streptomyces sp. NPDC059894]